MCCLVSVVSLYAYVVSWLSEDVCRVSVVRWPAPLYVNDVQYGATPSMLDITRPEAEQSAVFGVQASVRRRWPS